jgi:hypothetical protein
MVCSTGALISLSATMLDHSIICPIITTRPQADLPVVPIYTNIFAPPLQLPEVASAGGVDHDPDYGPPRQLVVHPRPLPGSKSGRPW